MKVVRILKLTVYGMIVLSSANTVAGCELGTAIIAAAVVPSDTSTGTELKCTQYDLVGLRTGITRV